MLLYLTYCASYEASPVSAYTDAQYQLVLVEGIIPSTVYHHLHLQFFFY